MAGSKRSGKSALYEGSTTYIVLCYAKMRKGWFTLGDYSVFQLGRREKLKNIGECFKRLAGNGYLVTDTGDRWRITLEGQQVLAELGAKRKKIEAQKSARNGQSSRAKYHANLMTVAEDNA
jgi:hypothetical protein